jgi:hypothetical protein
MRRRPALRALLPGALGGLLGVAAGAPWIDLTGAAALGIAGAAALGSGGSARRLALTAAVSLLGASVVAERIGLVYTGHPALLLGQLLPTVVVTLVAAVAGLLLRMTHARRRATGAPLRPPPPA